MYYINQENLLSVRLKSIGKLIYLNIADKIPQTCVIGHLFLFFFTEIY